MTEIQKTQDFLGDLKLVLRIYLEFGNCDFKFGESSTIFNLFNKISVD